MKKSKIFFCVLTIFIILIAILWGSITYVRKYQKTLCDTSTSSNEEYKLTLQAIGEPGWPLGAAKGRLILAKNNVKISQTDFELRNNGGSVNSSCWNVTWHDEYVKVIISGSEQFDEQIILYFNGAKDIKQLTAKTVNYQKYNGNWSTNGQSSEDIIKNGGTEFYVEIINDDELQGNLYSQQGTSERIAEVDNITGKIINGECDYSFSDDGWGNSGTLSILSFFNIWKMYGKSGIFP